MLVIIILQIEKQYFGPVRPPLNRPHPSTCHLKEQSYITENINSGLDEKMGISCIVVCPVEREIWNVPSLAQSREANVNCWASSIKKEKTPSNNIIYTLCCSLNGLN